jgi:hypothetical protein
MLSVVRMKMFSKFVCCSSIVSALVYHFIRWVYEGVIDDPYGEFFIAENKSLQKVLTDLQNLGPASCPLFSVLT